jgi:hypothetical protein
MKKIVALCSCPRLGFMDFCGQSIAAFAQNYVEYRNLYGVFWSQVLTGGIQQALDDGAEYIITTDYDSIFNTEDVAQLIRLADQNPHAEAICSMQMGRFSGLLVSTESGEITHKELKENPLVPVNTGHFGLTLLKASLFKDLPKPWFWSHPDADGEWKRNGEGKLDDDIYFWDGIKNAGKTLYLAPRITIGHLELLIKWPSDTLDGIYETAGDYQKHGRPQDVWK